MARYIDLYKIEVSVWVLQTKSDGYATGLMEFERQGSKGRIVLCSRVSGMGERRLINNFSPIVVLIKDDLDLGHLTMCWSVAFHSSWSALLLFIRIVNTSCNQGLPMISLSTRHSR